MFKTDLCVQNHFFPQAPSASKIFTRLLLTALIMSERSWPAQVGFACLHLSEISVHLAPDSSHRRNKHPHFLFCQHRAGVPGRCQSCPLFTSALGNFIVIYGGEVSFTTRSYLIYPALLSCKAERPKHLPLNPPSRGGYEAWSRVSELSVASLLQLFKRDSTEIFQLFVSVFMALL